MRDEKGRFITGGTSWNNGIKMNLSDEARKSLSENAKRNIAKETPEQRKGRIEKAIKTRTERGSTNNGRLGNTGDKDPLWKGEDANYNSKHRWIQNHWERTGICEVCNEKPVAKKVTRLKHLTHWHNISGKYIRDKSDWLEVCPSCHIKIHRNNLLI